MVDLVPLLGRTQDYHIAFDNHWYSVPHALVGERVELSVTQHLVRIRYKDNIITQHVHSQKPYQHTQSRLICR